MGNQEPKRSSVSKNQIQVACMKVKIHLEMMRQRRNQQIIKGQKQLVNKLHCKSRNKAQETLIMQRVVNGLKYTQAVTQLISYATTLKSMAAFLAQNKANLQKIQPWLPALFTLDYAADQLGLSSLNQYKQLMRNLKLNDPLLAEKYVNPEIKQLLSPTPTFNQVNIYVIQMCQRNNILTEQINSAGHKFSKSRLSLQNKINMQQPNSNHHQLSGIINQNSGNNNNQNYMNSLEFGNKGNQFSNQNNTTHNQNNQFQNQNIIKHNQGNGFQGNDFNGGQTPIQQQGTPKYYDNYTPSNRYTSNPYQNPKTPSVFPFNKSPNYFTPAQIQPISHQKQKNFDPYTDLTEDDPRKTVNDIYPQMNPDAYKENIYKPTTHNQSYQSNNNNGSARDTNINMKNSPTISTLMKDFDLK